MKKTASWFYFERRGGKKVFSTMLKALKELTWRTRTENGAAALTSTLSHCLDLFGTIGALREASEERIIRSFVCAYAENPDLAMRTRC